MIACKHCDMRITKWSKTGLCKSCFQKGKKVSLETRAKISAYRTGKHLSVEQKKKLSIANTGELNPNYGKVGPFTGRHHSKETKELQRKRAIERMTIDCSMIAKGKHEVELLDMLETLEGITIDREFRVIGYFPDGYCHETNTVFEVFEPYHFRQEREDRERRANIINELHCDYRIIYDEDAAKVFVRK